MEKTNKRSLELMLSLFTARTYFHTGFTEGFPAHSWRNEVRVFRRGRLDQFKLVDHEWAYRSLIKCIEQQWKGKFKNAIIYDNITGCELYWNLNDKVQANPLVQFYTDPKGNKFLSSFEFRCWNEDEQKNEWRTKQHNMEDIKAHSRLNWNNRKYLEEKNAFDCPLIKEQAQLYK